MSKLKAKAKKESATTTDAACQKDPKTDRFLAGNSGFGGRPKGARSKLTTQFFADFYAAWEEHGSEALKTVAKTNPKDFVKAAAMLMPKEFEIKTPLDDISDEELADLIAAIQSLIAGSAVIAPAGGERTASNAQ